MKKYIEMTAEELVKLGGIKRLGDKIKVDLFYIPKDRKDEFAAVTKARKPEIMAYLLAKEAAQAQEKAEHQAKIDAIEGLEEIRAAEIALEKYHAAFERMMEDESNDGVNPPAKPRVDIAALIAKYPRAAAYRKAESWTYSGHYAKSAAGQRAMERIENGEDHVTVLAEMADEWSTYCANNCD